MPIRLYRHYWIYFVISAFFLIPGLISLAVHGLRPGIDFTGGALITLEATQASEAATLSETNIREALGDEVALASLQTNSENQWLLRLGQISDEQRRDLLASISAAVTPVELVSFDLVGAVMGQELIQKTLIALALASVMLILYLRFRFKELSFGVAAFLAVIHDVTIIAGIFSLLGWFLDVEVDVLFVTALLTTISFSVHDTVVIYDRIRELKQRFPQANLRQLAEASVVATISRSFNNSLTVVFMLAALLLLGGVTLKYFALALLLGVVCGTYSSPFVSVPLILLTDDWQARRKKQPRRKTTP
jgi:preprotein translocase subunit SecF